jgi:pimeloyl-ACP methyl ester carboxylesterase
MRRRPFYLQSEKQFLFCWLHDTDVRPGHGVLICPPIGHEQVHAHRALRHLADALAEAGFPTLRLDYHGTGDSAGDLEEPSRHAAWLANLRSAVTWLQTEMACKQITLIGVRFGAALACELAADVPIADLVLWAPVVKGRGYVRELKALAMTAGTPAQASTDIEAAGFVITEQNAADFSGIDLLQLTPQCRRALIVERDDMPANPKLAEHFRSLGIDTHETVQPGYGGMMAEPHLTQVPTQAVAEIVAWVRDNPKADSADADCRNPDMSDRFVDGPLRERTLMIGATGELFGILSEPTATPHDGLPTIVLLNAGSAYRVGPNRLHVLLARRLTALGFRCLRLDLLGLGDSVHPDPARENDPYPASAFRDIDQTLRYLGRELGAKKVVLIGLCSGAYDAFQAAVQFPTGAVPEIAASFVINPLTFHWQEGMTVESAQSIKFQAFRESMASAGQPSKWFKLLTGRSKLGIKGALRVLLDRWHLTRQRQTANGTSEDASEKGHPKTNDLPGDLARIVKNKRTLAFFFARSDPGYDILTFYARRQVDEMTRAGQMRIHFIENADHTFSQKAAREGLIEGVVAGLRRPQQNIT